MVQKRKVVGIVDRESISRIRARAQTETTSAVEGLMSRVEVSSTTTTWFEDTPFRYGVRPNIYIKPYLADSRT